MNGLHLIADLYRCQCSPAILLDRELLEQLCVGECDAASLSALGTCFHQFQHENGEKAGVTGTVVLGESHVAIHTWPESGDVTLDVYVCNYSRDNSDRAERLFEAIIETLCPQDAVRHRLSRGAWSDAMSDRASIVGQAGYLVEKLNGDAGFFYRAGTPLESGSTPYQSYDVWDTPQFGRLFRLDGCFMTSEGDEFFYHENLIHVPAVAHPAPRTALVIGGGDGGSSEELFKHPSLERVVLVELDAEVIEIARKHFQAVHRGSLDDPRLELRVEDGLRYVTETGPARGERFDLIVLDLTDPVGPAEALYTEEFFHACKALLSQEGALSLHIGAPVFHAERVRALVTGLRRVFRKVRPYFVYIPLYGSLWGMACASDELDPAALPETEVDHRIAQRGLTDLQYYNGAVHYAQFALPNYLRTLLA